MWSSQGNRQRVDTGKPYLAHCACAHRTATRTLTTIGLTVHEVADLGGVGEHCCDDVAGRDSDALDLHAFSTGGGQGWRRETALQLLGQASSPPRAPE